MMKKGLLGCWVQHQVLCKAADNQYSGLCCWRGKEMLGRNRWLQLLCATVSSLVLLWCSLYESKYHNHYPGRKLSRPFVFFYTLRNMELNKFGEDEMKWLVFSSFEVCWMLKSLVHVADFTFGIKALIVFVKEHALQFPLILLNEKRLTVTAALQLSMSCSS